MMGGRLGEKEERTIEKGKKEAVWGRGSAKLMSEAGDEEKASR